MSALFKKYKEACLSQAASHPSHVEPLTHDLKIVLVDSGYVADIDTHQFLSDIGGGNIVATSPNLTGKTITDGVFDCDDVDFSGVTGSTVTQVVLFRDTGTGSTSPLMCWVNAGSGLPDVPTGAPVVYQVDPGAAKFFVL